MTIPTVYGVSDSYTDHKGRVLEYVLVLCPCGRVHTHGCAGLHTAHCVDGALRGKDYDIVLTNISADDFRAMVKEAGKIRAHKRQLQRKAKRHVKTTA